uniref:NADH-ubiquinone oxidoreductase chain 5 n=1 Tax=Trigonopterus sp. AH-2016 TaxID=1903843 RepID=A0A343C457_9CUCU|nr:NADH dehydrogenase subunit 5 [Trigonopterus sp. AH-2016]
MAFRVLYFSLFLMVSVIFYIAGLYLLYLNVEIFFEFDLVGVNSCVMGMVFLIDWVSLLFASFVLFISSMIMKYSEGYMQMDKAMKRFVFLMAMFVLSMLLVIFSSSLITVLLGWDGLGLVSYVLVIYYQNVKSFNAGMLTALSNRVGDGALLLGIAWMTDIGGWSYMANLDSLKSGSSLLVLGFFIVLASVTKSAQIPFSSWLPAAMSAPTPVSSLVHSSTLVTAGVYLLFRFSGVFSSGLMEGLLYLSLLTMFMAGIGANFEFDLKKIIALSTLSQLGMMLVIFSLGEKSLAFFHLLMHALLKALLFMCAGVIIHNLANCQDIRSMGSLCFIFPVTCSCFSVSSMALCGLPFLSGFYSKDLVAEALSMEILGVFVYLIFFISVGLTVSYSLRLSYYVFFGRFNGLSLNYFSEVNNKIMLKGMLGLVFLVIFKGGMLVWVLFPSPYFIVLPFFMKMVTLLMVVIGAWLGYELSVVSVHYNLKSLKWYMVSFYFSSMWNLPILSTLGASGFFLVLGKVYSKKFDYGWIEFYGSKGLFELVKNYTEIFQLVSRNHVKVFLMMIFMFFVYLIVFIMVV